MSTRYFCLGCGPCRPKWMKMVDNLYSGNPQETNSLSKLMHYCLHQPDKLDRIAKYLHHHLSQDLNRRYDQNIYISIDAINMLIKACHGQRLVLALSFLKMVQLLLETNRTDLQILASKSFVEFSQIDDDTPNYHKEYSDLLDHFSSKAHCSYAAPKERNKVRIAGICGIQGVVRKTLGDQLHIEVVHGSNMDKIIPSLLFNICEKSELDSQSEEPQNDPSQEAVFVFKDVVCRASYTNIKPVVASILTHLDNHHLWDPCDFPLLIFRYLLDSIENTQLAHSLVKQLVAHLSTHESDFTLAERTSLVQVIGLTVIGLTKGAIGPDVFHNFKALLEILRSSIDKTPQELTDNTFNDSGDMNGERQFQVAIINTIAEFAKNLPDTQKIEILKFILNFEPMFKYHSEYGDRPKPLMMVLLQTMLTVATQYRTVTISNALNFDFLNILLRGVAVDPDPAIRIIVQKILHTLIDRHGNSEQLLTVRIYRENELQNYFVLEEPSRQDILFMKRTGILLTENIYHQLLDPSNKVDNLEHLSCTVGLVALEMGADLVISELFRLILAVQSKLVEENNYLPLTHRCALHALLASAITLIVQLSNLQSLYQHVYSVITARENSAPWLLPSSAFNRSNTTNSYPNELDLRDELLFSLDIVTDALNQAGYDVSIFSIPYHPVYPKLYDTIGPDAMSDANRFFNAQSKGWPSNYPQTDDYHPMASGANNIDSTGVTGVGLTPDNLDPNARNSLMRSASSFSLTDSLYSATDSAQMVDEFLSFKNMRRIITDARDNRSRSKLGEEDRLLNYYSTTEFSDICAQQRDKTLTARAQLAEVLDDISLELHPISESNPKKYQLREYQSGADQILFPKLVASDSGVGGIATNMSSSGIQIKQRKTQQLPPVTWERDYGSLFVA